MSKRKNRAKWFGNHVKAFRVGFNAGKTCVILNKDFKVVKGNASAAHIAYWCSLRDKNTAEYQYWLGYCAGRKEAPKLTTKPGVTILFDCNY